MNFNIIKKYSLFILAGICILFSACSREPEKLPNILLITIDALRADHLSVYGFKKRTTKHIDHLAEEGVTFDAAHCDVTWTTPSMASTLTGKYSYRHRLRSSYTRLAESETTVAEYLKKAGYATAAVVGSYPLDSIYGLNQGFDTYDDNFTVPIFIGSKKESEDVPSKLSGSVKEQDMINLQKVINKSRRTDEEGTAVASEVLRGFTKISNPFFLWIHYFGPHSIHDMTKSGMENLRRHVDTYPDKVFNADMAVGGLIKALDDYGFSDNTLVILHADHGESLGQHGFIGHGRYLYEDDLRVPLIMRWPGRIPEGKQRDMLVGNIDIAATILDAAGIFDTATESMDGKSLFPAIKKDKKIHDSMYIETYMPAHSAFAERLTNKQNEEIRVGVRRFGIFRTPWKYVKTEYFPIYSDTEIVIPDEMKMRVAKEELYDIELDPGELKPLDLTSNNYSFKMQGLMDLLNVYISKDEKDAESGRVEINEEHFEKLKSLGYVK